MSRHYKTFAPRNTRFEEQANTTEEQNKYEQITSQDAKISLTKTEVTKITHTPFKNQAFNKVERGLSVMRYSDNGLHVQKLNNALNELGYKVPENETFFGEKTQYALATFQQDQGIKASGIFDAETLLKMDEPIANSETKNYFKETEKEATNEQQKEIKENYFSSSQFGGPFTLYLIEGKYYIYLNVVLPKDMEKGKDEFNAAIYYYQSTFGYSEQDAKLIAKQRNRSFLLYGTYPKGNQMYKIDLDAYIHDLYFGQGLNEAEIDEIIAEIISNAKIINDNVGIEVIDSTALNKIVNDQKEAIEARKNILNEYIANIEQLDPALLKHYLDGDKKDEFIESLKYRGLSEDYVEEFLLLFRSEINRKSLQMLDENETLLEEVQEFYKDENKLDELTDIISGSSPAIESAILKFANVVTPFLRNFVPRSALPRNDKVKNEYLQLIEIYGGKDFDAFLRNLGNITNDNIGIFNGGDLINNLRNDNARYILNTPSFFANYLNLIAAHINDLDDDFVSNRPAIKTLKKEVKKGDFNGANYLNERSPELNQSVEDYKNVLIGFQSSSKAQDHKVLKDLTLNFNKLTFLGSKKAIKEEIKNSIYTEKPQNIATVREKIADDPDFLWGFSPVINKVMEQYGIISNSKAASIIKDKIADEAFDSNVISLIIGGLSLILAVAGFFTGGITTLAGGILIGSSVALSVTDLIIEYNKYKYNTAASNTSLGGYNELADLDQSLLPVILSIAGLGIDLLDVIRVAKAISKTVKLGKSIKSDALVLFKQLKTEGKLANVTEEAFLKNLKQYNTFSENLKIVTDKKFLRFLEALGEEQSSLVKVGLYRLQKDSPEVFKFISETKNLDVVLVSRLGTQMAVNPSLSKGVDDAFKLLGNDISKLNNVMSHFGDVGSKFIDDLPEFVSLIQRSNAAKHPELIQQLLGDYRYLNTVLNNSDNALETLNDITKRWESFIKGKRNVTFSEFLKRGGNNVPGINISITNTPNKKTIAEFFEGQTDMLHLFASVGEHSKKNLALWEITEPALVAAYRNKTLPANVQKAIDKLIDTNLLGTSGLNSGLANARGKVVATMNKAIGESSTIADIRRLDELNLISQQASRGSVFEEWIRFNHKNGKLGAKDWGELLGKLSFSAEELKSLGIFKTIIGDAHYLDDGSKILVEFKNITGKLSGEPIEQMRNYKKLIDAGKIDEVEYVFSTLEAAEKNYDQLIKEFGKKNVIISYVSEKGQKTLYLK
jgi:peptidoglycan hydrolase-like protein with peptidoglycan-binding domain